ncbi:MULTISPECIES: isochorismatase family cysteine hydrolase [Bacillus]|uniref:isochorismatase family cysteine hydrolase n=1 Tax=Bacillus TaxID=1386 RepID=UPI000C76BD09|nr:MULTISPECIES: isochorismatase family cysteine hydrolase [Bacillus]MCR6608761.1 cysteine hydrolase [Bacillus infantis]PLR69990.1 isochorismatase [Bacillus sp. UMB0728]
MKESSTALLIIDMINNFDFPDGEILAEKAEKISRPIKTLKEKCAAEAVPVIYVNDHYSLWQADFEKIADYCRNENSRDIIDCLYPSDEDYFLIKPKHSAFYGTALNTLLLQLNVKNLIITGVAGNICVLFTANDAYMREYSLYVPENCLASNDDHDNENALKMMKNVLNARTEPFSEKNSISACFPS